MKGPDNGLGFQSELSPPVMPPTQTCGRPSALVARGPVVGPELEGPLGPPVSPPVGHGFCPKAMPNKARRTATVRTTATTAAAIESELVDFMTGATMFMGGRDSPRLRWRSIIRPRSPDQARPTQFSDP